MIQSLEDPFYYLANFQTVLDWIGARYNDLLSADERQFIEVFARQPVASQALFVRMMMRKGILFRASKLNYAEIGSIAAAVQSLRRLGWVDDCPPLTLEQLFNLSTKAELLAFFSEHELPRGLKKDELLQGLLAHNMEARSFAAWSGNANDTVYALTAMPLCDRFRLMFFGNLQQDWTEFVLADLGLFHYEKVPFSADSRAFQQRGDIDDYLHLHDCRERFESYREHCENGEAINNGEAIDNSESFANRESLTDILEAIAAVKNNNPWIEARRAKLLFRIGEHLERSKDFSAAQRIYGRCNYRGARLRHIRVLERLQQNDIALQLALSAEQAPESAAEQQQLLRILPRLYRRAGLPKKPSPARAAVQTLELQLPKSPHGVEQAVLEHLHTMDAPVHYVENALINSLFGLLCWDAVFAPVAGAFFHPFQSGPADLAAPEFYSRRADIFIRCFAQLDSDDYRHTILKNFERKYGLQSPFVYWQSLDEQLLQLALTCLPPAHLKKWFWRILQDISANRAGFPDLIRFWPAQKNYQMIEVKGPGDRLQDNQLRWIEHCAEHGMPIAVCYVQWQRETA
jgi:VRR-NUC domain-containing protein/Fanconi-associated nuclease 1-like protein/Fanconi anemia protein nuclease-like protein